MMRIFISYRRADSQAITGRIHDRLEVAYGEENVFKDVDDIPPGSDFPSVIRNAIRECDVMLVIIGPRWVDLADADGQRRLDAPDDFVRLEVETGLNQIDMRVIPVLVDGATMPASGVLPESIRPLARLNAVTVRHDPDFRRDMERLIEQLNKLMIGHISGVRTLETEDETPPPEPRKIRRANVLVAGVILAILVMIGGALLVGSGGDDDPTSAQATYEASVEQGLIAEWTLGTELLTTYEEHLRADPARLDDDPTIQPGVRVRVAEAPEGDIYTYDPDNAAGFFHWFYVREVTGSLEGWLPIDALDTHEVE